ncbi:two-component sensor histidine kinase [Pseudonocardia sp. CNS-004]|nr:two-component sensor histidine kinase [Pseudonocardia sp. CNS-004]
MGDVGLGVVFAVILVVTADAIGESWGGLYWLFDTAAGLVVCGIALLRRRHRAGAAAAGLSVAATALAVSWATGLPQEPGPAMALAVAVLVGAAVRTLPGRSALAVAAAGAALVAGTWCAEFLSSSGIAAVTTLNTAGWLGALTVGLSGRLLHARRRAAAEKVRREERMELARELHDVAAHHLTGIVVQAQAAQLVARKRPDRQAGPLADIEAAGSDALCAIRRVVGLLRDGDDAVPVQPGFEQLSGMVRQFEGRGGAPAVHLRVPDGEPLRPSEVTSTVYRVVQESLTNIARHAPAARSVTVDVARDLRSVTVEVTDDAPAAATRSHRDGYGLIGMRERVEALGGTLRAGPHGDAGWSVRVTLPLPPSEPR